MRTDDPHPIKGQRWIIVCESRRHGKREQFRFKPEELHRPDSTIVYETRLVGKLIVATV